jgi:hypothetical protein
MARRHEDGAIDRLYQLPLEEFTAARNALAKESGADGAAIRKLPKPPLAAWAVNQLYWNARGTYSALVESSDELRRTHQAVLAGRTADLRTAGRAHDRAVDAAVKATMAIVEGAGHPASDATRQAVVSTLRALPSEAPSGRLTTTLQPGGFEMLAGFQLARAPGKAEPAKPAAQKGVEKPAGGKKGGKEDGKEDSLRSRARGRQRSPPPSRSGTPIRPPGVPSSSARAPRARPTGRPGRSSAPAKQPSAPVRNSKPPNAPRRPLTPSASAPSGACAKPKPHSPGRAPACPCEQVFAADLPARGGSHGLNPEAPV